MPEPKLMFKTILKINAFAFSIALIVCIDNTAEAECDYAPDCEVFYAGIAFTGSEIYSVDSYASSILNSENEVRFTRSVLDSYRNNPSSYINLITDELARTDGSTSQIVVALGIDRENVSVEDSFDGRHKVIITLWAQIIFYDFDSGQILNLKPITLEYIGNEISYPTRSSIHQIFEEMLLGGSQNSLPYRFAYELSQTESLTLQQKRVRVTSVSVNSEEMEFYDRFKSAADSGIIGYEFTKHLADVTDISIIPPSNGQMLGQSMTARFNNSDIYNFSLPDPDYEISIRISQLKSGVIRETGTVKVHLFGTYFEISVVEPVSRTIYFSHELRQGATKTVPLAAENINRFSSFYETLLVGFQSFANAIVDPRSKWISDQVSNSTLSGQFTDLNQLFKEL